MNAQELRIGNWVLKHFEGGVGEAELVTSRTIFDCQANPTGKFSYSGIPLTPEVLEKCGFVKDTGDNQWGGWLSPEYNEERSRIRKDEFGYFWATEPSTCPVRFDGLHKLQNFIYIMTGTELNYTP